MSELELISLALIQSSCMEFVGFNPLDSINLDWLSSGHGSVKLDRTDLVRFGFN